MQQTDFTWLTIDISVSNITPMFLPVGLGIMSQSPILITVMSNSSFFYRAISKFNVNHCAHELWFARLMRDDVTSATVLSSFNIEDCIPSESR